MEPLYKVILLEIWDFLSNRVFILTIVFALMFYILASELFQLQVVRSEEYQKKARPTSEKVISLDAPRGQIYDRMGRPLAVNETAFCIKIDPAVRGDNSYQLYKNLVEVLGRGGEELLLDFPFTYDPIAFTFDGNKTKETHFKKDMGIPPDEVDAYDAEKTYGFLLNLFKVPDTASREEVHQTLAIAAAVYQERFRLSHITIALNVSERTVAIIEEQKSEFPGAYADIIYLRQYPAGKEFAHLLGYIRKISKEELEENEENGYDSEDMYGKVGIERAFETDLHGVKGEKIVEVDAGGRHIRTLSVTEPIPGDKIFLTIDIELQKKVVSIIENTLTDILLGRLEGRAGDGNVNMTGLFTAMIEAYTIDSDMIIKQKELSPVIHEQIMNHIQIPLEEWKEDTAKDALVELYTKGQIRESELLLFLYRDGQLSFSDEELRQLENNSLNIRNTVLALVQEGSLTPQMANIEPTSGSAMIIDVSDGAVLASAAYPNYDNNQFVNQFNNEYYLRIQKDPTLPMINRPFSEGRAPGSTFKMVTAYAGLASGTIQTTDIIRDYGTFTKAGIPYAHCNTRVAGYHGLVDIRGALEYSCNYFFYETAYRMGNASNGSTIEGIELFNGYMEDLGIGVPTGIEISELRAVMPSPSYKEEVTLSNPYATVREAEWKDGESIRAAIGQSVAKITPATMAKYVMTIANGGKRFSLHFLDGSVKSDENSLNKYEPRLELDLQMDPEHTLAIHEGMRRVITGSRGTGRNVFANFPIDIAGKTGTAQEQGRNHFSFASFAPYDNPEIATYVVIPFSENNIVRSPAAAITKEMYLYYYDLDEKNIDADLPNNKLLLP